MLSVVQVHLFSLEPVRFLVPWSGDFGVSVVPHDAKSFMFVILDMLEFFLFLPGEWIRLFVCGWQLTIPYLELHNLDEASFDCFCGILH
jgi:hypothetical protein